jgi:hypothetical protein
MSMQDDIEAACELSDEADLSWADAIKYVRENSSGYLGLKEAFNHLESYVRKHPDCKLAGKRRPGQRD